MHLIPIIRCQIINLMQTSMKNDPQLKQLFNDEEIDDDELKDNNNDDDDNDQIAKAEREVMMDGIILEVIKDEIDNNENIRRTL